MDNVKKAAGIVHDAIIAIIVAVPICVFISLPIVYFSLFFPVHFIINKWWAYTIYFVAIYPFLILYGAGLIYIGNTLKKWMDNID